MTGRIIFYNPHAGTGKILTKVGRKFDFSVNEWEDFDVLPETGVMVSFTAQGEKAVAIGAQGGAAAPAKKPSAVPEPEKKTAAPPPRPTGPTTVPSIPRNLLKERPDPAVPSKFSETVRKLRELGETLRRAKKGTWLNLEPTHTIQECAEAYFRQLTQVIGRHKEAVQQADLLDYTTTSTPWTAAFSTTANCKS